MSLSVGSGIAEIRASVSVEHQLLARALEGDGRAFSSLVEPHLAMLYRLAARACGSRSLAEDAVQEALGAAYAKLALYQPGTSLRAFLAAIAVRRAHTLLRGETRRNRYESAEPQPGEPPADAELSLDRARARARIREALGRLPKKRREVALLRLDADLGYAEIAQIVGGSEGSARVLVHLALQDLKKALGDLTEPSGSKGK